MQMDRRMLCAIFLGSLLSPCAGGRPVEGSGRNLGRPNILLAIADDQSWPHARAYGDRSVRTPASDRVAREGVLFTHAFCPASQCGPSRASLLTGRNIWQLAEAGTQGSYFPARFTTYTELLEEAGYHVGYTGKPWAPGNWKGAGRERNPAGYEYDIHELEPPTAEISSCDYAANFAEFLDSRPKDAPFCFWYGCHEPHRNYEEGSGIRAGKSVDEFDFPPFYPDNEIVRSDLTDYKLEIEWFDRHLGLMLAELERRGELANTLVVVTADNGMPFPRAKATLYEAGTRVPLAAQWPARIPKSREVDDLVSFVDLAPTFVEAAGLPDCQEMTGRSLMEILSSTAEGRVDSKRKQVVLGKERHNHARADNLGYPTRAIRTEQYLYVRNLKPDRWPMGDPPGYFCHTKMINPTKEFILKNQTSAETRRFYTITYAKRPGEELFDLKADPHCMRNLAEDPSSREILEGLRAGLDSVLKEQGDPRVGRYGDVFESYPYFGRMQPGIGGFREMGKYNPEFLPPGYTPVR